MKRTAARIAFAAAATWAGSAACQPAIPSLAWLIDSAAVARFSPRVVALLEGAGQATAAILQCPPPARDVLRSAPAMVAALTDWTRRQGAIHLLPQTSPFGTFETSMVEAVTIMAVEHLHCRPRTP